MAERETMRVISVNVGLPRDVAWHGKLVSTGIFKEPVAGRIAVRRLNLDGDRQADLSVHGGVEKAVYAYPVEYYRQWQNDLPGQTLPWGMFGENLTTEGLLDDTISIGDRYRVGSAELRVTQPRLPCYKLGIKFGRDKFVKLFLKSGRTGFYFAVEREGEVEAGDPITLIERDPHGIHVSDITRLYVRDRGDLERLRRVVEAEAVPVAWRDFFRKRIELIASVRR